MRAEGLEDEEPLAQMNFIPLIDIALTLVIILMVTTAVIKKPGVQLKLPETRTQEGSPETARDLVIAISREGQFFVNGQRLAANGVLQRLTNVAGKNKDARVLVKGDRDVPYRKVMEVMDLARQAGLSRIMLPTDPLPTSR